jgi:hypothetical protein
VPKPLSADPVEFPQPAEVVVLQQLSGVHPTGS